MSTMLAGRRVAILAADGVEQIELISPRRAVTEAGGVVDLISLRPGTIQAMNHDLIPAQRFVVDKTVSEISVDEYDALVLPGRTKNPDNLRAHEGAVSFVREFVTSGKPVVSSRSPEHLTAFCAKLVEEIAEGTHPRRPGG